MPKTHSYGKGLKTAQLTSLFGELQALREHPPIVSRGNGKYEGDILGFVKGLRLSVRVIYFLREALSETDYEINWGHLIDSSGASCSPECDIIIHTKGHVRQWNGHGEHSVMDFRFIEAEKAKVVVSCKSALDKIDKKYPKSLKRFGIKSIFLFAECCRDTCYKAMKQKARKAGYSGLWCLYCTTKEKNCKTDDNMGIDFIDKIRKALAV